VGSIPAGDTSKGELMKTQARDCLKSAGAMVRVGAAILLVGIMGAACSRTNQSGSATGATPTPEEATPKEAAYDIQAKLNGIIFPELDVPTESLSKVLDLLKQKSVELDTAEPNPTKRGVNIVVQLPTGGNMPQVNAFSLTNKSLGTVIEQVCASSGMKLKIDPYAVEIVPVGMNTDVMITKQYKMAVPFDSNMAVEDSLKQQGVPFPPGTSAMFFPAYKVMVVHDTQTAIESIDAIVAKKNASGGN
jgi:hypothetical protein